MTVSRILCWVTLALTAMPRFTLAATPVRGGAVGVTELNAAIRANDSEKVATLLGTLWQRNKPEAQRISLALVSGDSIQFRLIGIAMLAKNADSATLSSAARDLRPMRFAEDRRLLVRALGRTQDQAALEAIQQYLANPEPAVRSAAIQALADQKRLLAVELLTRSLPAMHEFTDIEGDGDDFFIACNRYGAIRSLTQLHAADSSGITTWWQSARAEVGVATVPVDLFAGHQPTAPANGKFMTRDFYIRFNPASVEGVMLASLRKSGIPTWTDFATKLDKEAGDTRALCAAIFGGPVHAPLVRLEISDDRTIAASGGVSRGYGGFADGTRITFHVSAFNGDWQTTLRHEYTHILHGMTYREQPRWICEGLAQSIAAGRQSAFKTAKTPAADVSGLLSTGAASTAIAWNSGPGGEEGPRYLASYLLFDYLRFGVTTLPEARLCALMDRLGHGEPAESALVEVYGTGARDLDQSIRAWIASPPTPAPASPPAPVRGARARTN